MQVLSRTPLILTIALIGWAPQSELLAQQSKSKRKPGAVTVAELQKKFPFVSLEPRLEYERKRVEAEPDRPLPKPSPALEEKLEVADSAGSGDWFGLANVRRESLRLLHSAQAEEFIKRQGFGRTRMPRPSPGALEYALPSISFANIPLPPTEFEDPKVVLREEEPSSKTAGEVLSSALNLLRRPTDVETASRQGISSRMPSRKVLADYFGEHVSYFVDPPSLGYVVDRKRVAGFVPHGITESRPWEYPIPSSEEEAKTLKRDEWAISSLELISLLKHERPVAYISDHLPRMDDLQEARTRPLSAFEEKSLPALVAGEEIVASATPNRIVMLGALRASKTCLTCHYVQRGELLGVFSYDLRRRPVALAVERTPAE